MRHIFHAAFLVHFIVIGLLVFSIPCYGQVNGTGPSDPALFDTVFNTIDDVPLNNVSVRSVGGIDGETAQLNLLELFPFSLAVEDGGEVNVIGGGVSFLDASMGSEFNLVDGIVDGIIEAAPASQINISGGVVGPFQQTASVDAAGSAFINDDVTITEIPGAEVNLSGGNVGTLRGGAGSTFNISGGSFGVLGISSEASINFTGGEFKLGDVSQTGNSVLLNNNIFGNNPDNIFTGTLADGSPFIISLDASFTSGPQTEVNLANVNLPPVDTNPIVVNASTTDVPNGLREGQTLTLQAGGQLGRNFNIVDATLNIDGGSLTGNFFDGASAVRSTINLIAGDIGFTFTAFEGTTVNVSGGTISGRLRAREGSIIDVSGGQIDSLSVANGSVATIRGGTFGGFGNGLNSTVELIGGEFKLNGIDVTQASVSVGVGDVFTATLSDGSTFVVSSESRLGGLIPSEGLNNARLTSGVVPAVSSETIVVDSAFPAIASGLRNGQSMLLVEGGRLGHAFDVVDADFQMTGGALGDNSGAYRSNVDISGGAIGSIFAAGSGSEVNIRGGVIGLGFTALADSTVNISGGQFLTPDSYPNPAANSGSVINWFGSEFSIDDSPVNSGVISQRDVVLSGTLLDGTEFEVNLDSRYFDINATLTVEVAPVLGDMNLDGVFDFLDISPFIAVLASAAFQDEADINRDGVVDFLDIAPFIAKLNAQ